MKLIFRSILVMIFGITCSLNAQDPYIDSLVSILKSATNDTVKCSILEELSDNAPDGEWQRYNEQIGVIANRMMSMSNKTWARAGKKYYAVYLNNRAFELAEKADYPNALDYYERCLKLNREIGDIPNSGLNLNNIGAIYDRMKEPDKALENYFEALAIHRVSQIKNDLCSTLNNIAVIYGGKDDTANEYKYYKEAMDIAEKNNLRSHIVTTIIRGLGDNMQRRGDYTQATKYYQRSLAMATEIGDKSTTSSSLLGLAKVSIALGKSTESRAYAERALTTAQELDYPIDIRDAAQILADIYEKQGEYKLALEMDRLAGKASANINKKENQKSVIRFQYKYEYDKKEALAKVEQEKKDAITKAEVRRQKLVRNGFIGGFTVMLMFAGIFFMQRNRIKKGKKLSDELLLNILPAEIAEELKVKGSAEAQLIDQATVLFTDFKGFTSYSEKLSPKKLVSDINECFSAFDLIMQKYGVEKIKTIGDSYMAAGGLPVKNSTHASDVVQAALQIQTFMLQHKRKKEAAGESSFEIRIGVHTGPVVAGIVGIKKFAYDIWGDTVNTASRMESSGEVGKVNISETTYELVKNEFKCVHRGKIEAKNKGEIDMYFVEN